MCLEVRILFPVSLDYILVYQEHLAKRDEKLAENSERRREKREFFHSQLEKKGLQLETAQQDSNVSIMRRK